jgi:hypothetical protein
MGVLAKDSADIAEYRDHTVFGGGAHRIGQVAHFGEHGVKHGVQQTVPSESVIVFCHSNNLSEYEESIELVHEPIKEMVWVFRLGMGLFYADMTVDVIIADISQPQRGADVSVCGSIWAMGEGPCYWSTVRIFSNSASIAWQG